jgi:hypothetical protein
MLRIGGRLGPVAGDHDTSWIRDDLLPFSAHAVGTLVPVVFEAYGRIFHPASTRDGAAVRWETVAAWSGRTMHALAQFDRLARPRGATTGPPPFDQRSAEGGLPRPALDALVDRLAAHTTTPDACFIGAWEGYGWLDLGPFDTLHLVLPERTHLVFTGPLDAVADVGWTEPAGSFVREAPSVIWPADRTWFVASDVDQDSTYLGGSRDLIEALVTDPRLEVWPIAPTDPITFDSDSINTDEMTGS